MYKRSCFYRLQARLCQPIDKFDLDFGSDACLLILQSISWSNLDDSDVVSESTTGTGEGATRDMVEDALAQQAARACK